jgi:Glycosyl transferase family 2
VNVVMTLLVRDEEDVVDEQLRYHLEHGVDFVIATDHRSVDGTTEILRSYERDGHLHYISEQREEYLQAEFVTRMARLAATDYRANWVINADADEFWWPRDGSFAEIFASVPERFGAVLGFWRHFVLRPDDDRPFFERMIWRRRPTSDWNDQYHVSVKAAHRGHPQVEVTQGNHKVLGTSIATLREWLPLEVLHFPIRSTSQLRRKFSKERTNVLPPPYKTRIDAELETAGIERVVGELVVGDEALAAGLADRTLTRDTRIRDALRHAGAGMRRPTLEDDVVLASEYSDYASLIPGAKQLRLLDGLRRRAKAIGA